MSELPPDMRIRVPLAHAVRVVYFCDKSHRWKQTNETLRAGTVVGLTSESVINCISHRSAAGHGRTYNCFSEDVVLKNAMHPTLIRIPCSAIRTPLDELQSLVASEQSAFAAQQHERRQQQHEIESVGREYAGNLRLSHSLEPNSGGLRPFQENPEMAAGTQHQTSDDNISRSADVEGGFPALVKTHVASCNLHANESTGIILPSAQTWPRSPRTDSTATNPLRQGGVPRSVDDHAIARALAVQERSLLQPSATYSSINSQDRMTQTGNSFSSSDQTRTHVQELQHHRSLLTQACPVCNKEMETDLLQYHVEVCLHKNGVSPQQRTSAVRDLHRGSTDADRHHPTTGTTALDMRSDPRSTGGLMASWLGGASALGNSLLGAVRPTSSNALGQSSNLVCRFCRIRTESEESLHLHLVTAHESELTLEEAKARWVDPPDHFPFNFGLTPVPNDFVEQRSLDNNSTLAQNQAHRRLGRMRGIQGVSNSCYLDATLFAMFALNSSFDGYFFPPNAGGSALEPFILRTHLKTNIVNELRGRGFVSSDAVVTLRRMMSRLHFAGNDFASGDVRERDAEEVFSFLLEILQIQHFQRLCEDPPPSLSLFDAKTAIPSLSTSKATHGSSSCDVHSIQLLLNEARGQGAFRKNQTATTQELLTETLAVMRMTLCTEVMSDNLVLIIPRHSSTQRVLSAVIPSSEVVVKSHQHVFSRTPSLLDADVPGEPPLHVQDQVPLHSVGAPDATYELHGMCTIGQSHYIAFARDVAREDSGLRQWYAFDSMADRIGDTTVPEVRPADLSWLDSGDALAESLRAGDHEAVDALPDLRRVLSDVSLCFYSRVCGRTSASSLLHGN